MMVIRAEDHKLAQHRILHFISIHLYCIYFNNDSKWPQFLKIALKGTVMVPKFTITNLLVWILLLETLVARVAVGIHSESYHQIDLIEELHLLNTTYNGLSVEENFYHFNPTIFLFEDNSRNIRYPSYVYERAAYLISQSNEFTFIASVKQNKQNTGTIISFTEGINRFLELQSSGRKNEIRLHYRHDNIVYTETFPFNIADEKWHKIALSVSAIHIDLYIDCNHIYKREIHEIDRDLYQHSNVTLWLGQRYMKHFLYRGYMRDVKIVSRPNGYIAQCPHLDTDCPTCGQFKSLQNLVINLENVVKKLAEKLSETERRLSNVEECDCFKSCNVNGSLHPEGSTWKQNCDICSCVRGEVTCRPIHCPTPCKNPEKNPNECCPVCKKTCFLNGQVLQHGERSKVLDSKKTNNIRCGECVCNDGKTSCRQINIETMCPKLNCSINEQYSREGECCKFCAGADFCSAGSDCHPNATCHNLKAEYACSCNEGFRGNGKVCQDIDECAREGGNDGHHCGQNTKCINLSGSYKCECLEGFSRLDKYKCIDIDECSKELNKCHENAICINTPGSYECQCKPGYESIDGFICKPICEQMCLNGGQCLAPNICSCRKGYFGQSCETDIDECKLGLYQCPANSICVNKPGWYHCQCREGYKRKLINNNDYFEHSCQDIDECSTGLHTCHHSAKCVNEDGGYHCECKSTDNSEGICSINCIHNNIEYSDGNEWTSDNDSCMKCSCNKGVVTCHKPTCNCKDAQIDLDCCPQCDISSRVCHHQKDPSIKYRTGQTWVYDCQMCECMFGEIDCWDMDCPPNNCLNPIRKHGDCCPRCEDDPCQSSQSMNSTNINLSHSGCKHLGHSYQTGEKIAIERDCASCMCQNGHLCCTYTSLCINQLLISTQTTHKNSSGLSNGLSNSKMKRIGPTSDGESNEDKSEQARRLDVRPSRHRRTRN